MGFSLGGFVSDLFGSKNKTHADTPQVDPNAYQYGGRVGGADAAAGRYAQTGQNAQGRIGAQADYGQANQDYAQSQQARQGQQTLASVMQARALGQTPSIAGMQAQQDMQRAAAAQSSLAASARGPAAMALAQQQAANNTANAQGQISGQAQVNAANERMQAEQAASGAYGNLRAGDQQSQGQNAQQQQFNAQLGQNQHALNDQMQLGMTQAELGVRSAQLGASQNQQAQQSANALGATGINAGVAGQNASMNQSNGMAVVGLGQKAAGAAAMAKGGPAKMGAPYIVGEQGPELVVPSQDSVVVPNHVAFPTPGQPTWGTSQTPAPAPRDLRGDPNDYFYSERDARAPMTGGMAVPGFSPGIKATADQPLRQMDQDKLASVRAQQAEGLDVSDKDQQAANGASFRERQSRRNDGQAAADAAAPAKKPTLSSVMGAAGDETMRNASRVDTSYHGGGGYIPPQLIPIGGARAMGGPVDAGVPYLTGEQGPEVLQPMSGPGAPGHLMTGPPTDSADKAVQQFYSGYHAKAPSHQPGMAFLADGGEAPAGKPAVVGERGPEMVVEAPKEPTWNGSPLARALASRKSQEAPPAMALKEGDGEYLQQSADGHAYMATAPSEDDGRPSLASRMKTSGSPAPAAGAAPPPPAPPARQAQRAMTPDEMMAAANAMGQQQQADHDARMAQGPAVRMPVTLGQAPDGTPVAKAEPEKAIAFSAQRPEDGEQPLEMPPSPTALPPPQHPPIAMINASGPTPVQWTGTNYQVLPKELPASMSRRTSLASRMRKR